MVFQWSTDELSPSINVHDQGTYALTAGDGFCFETDSILLTHHPVPIVKLDAPAVYCIGDHVTLDAYDPNIFHYRWQNGSTRSSLIIDSAGIYAVSAEHRCGVATRYRHHQMV